MSLAVVVSNPPARLLVARTAAWLLLCVVEAIVTSWLFDIPYWFSGWGNPFYYVRQLTVLAIISGVAFGILAWPRRLELAERWQRSQAGHGWVAALTLNLALFAVLTVATVAVTAYSAGRASPPWAVLTAYGLLLAVTAISLARIDVTISSSLRIVVAFRNEIAIAAAVGFGVQLLSLVSIHGWEQMAAATLTVSKAILDLYETDVAIDATERIIRIGDFAVVVTRNCSGYEGIALVTAFLSVYLWVFRSSLRFPRAFLLYPIGIVAIWTLNCLRIALLASLGAHVSPEIAVQGFHSQAGWIAFLVATVGIMVVAQNSAFYAAAPLAPQPRTNTGERIILAFLAPFMALMLASMLMAAVAPHDRPIYAVKVIAVGAALWLSRDIYRGWSWRLPPEAVVIGLAVGAVWIATDPNPAGGSELLEWLESQGPMLAGAWLVLRVVGASITVPIAEELAFRGLLHRWLIARDFENVPFERFAIVAFCVSSLLFGLMHERWIAGTLSGAVFALVMYRTKSIAGPIAAHMAANALISAWAIGFRQWSLL